MQQEDINFVYPNKVLNQFDVEIVHDINDNCVSGTVTNFSATTFTSTGMTLSFTYSWSLNGAKRMLNFDNTQTMVLSLHGMYCTTNVYGNNSSYFSPWRMLYHITGTTSVTGQTATVTTGVLTPSMFGLTSFSTGVYIYEFRMIGEDCVTPISLGLTMSLPATPTPTPTNTNTPTPTSTSTPIPATFTPTPSPSPLPPTFTPTPSPTPGGPATFTPTPTLTSTPTPTPVVYTFSLGYNASDSYAACLDYSSSPANYYSYNSTFTNGTILYTTNGTPLTDNAPTGYYSDGSNVGYVSGNSGVITGVGPCVTNTPTPSPTPIYQGVAIYTGATFNTSVDACANGSSPNGTVYASAAELPVGDGDRLWTNLALTTNFVGNDKYYRLFINPSFYVATISAAGYISNFIACSSVATPTPTASPTPTPIYNYYEFTPCTGGASVYYRSITSLALGDVYTFASYPPDQLCYEITDINASPNTNDLPTIYGPLSGCGDSNCIPL
jgi:hypothetical protein